MNNTNLKQILVIVLAVFSVSWAAILVRWSGDTPALVIAFYRMFWSVLLLSVLGLIRRKPLLTVTKLSRRDQMVILVSGVMLALHFGAWILSLQLTTVAKSLVLMSTHPIFALLLAPVFLKERISGRGIIAVILAMIGTIIIADFASSSFGGELGGDLLALFSALCVTVYFLIGRYQRDKLDLVVYLAWVYAAAAFTLAVLCLLANYEMFNYSLQTHLVMFLLAAIPTGIGHSLLNWATRRIEVYKVNLAMLGEPVIGTFLAFLFFAEVPFMSFYVGAAIILFGIVVAVHGERVRNDS